MTIAGPTFRRYDSPRVFEFEYAINMLPNVKVTLHPRLYCFTPVPS